MENAWVKKALGIYSTDSSRDSNSGVASRIAAGPSAGNGMYFCVIDKFCYASLNTALAHVKIQHGLTARAELLVREKPIGEAL